MGKNKKGIKDITSESYLQTIGRRFRKHHLAAVSFVVLIILGGAALLAPVIAPYDREASAARPTCSSGWERIRSAGMCSAGFCMPCVFPCLWELWQR